MKSRGTSFVRAGLLASLVLGLSGQDTRAQDDPEESESEVSPQIWVDYNPSKRLNDRWELYGDVGVRTELQSSGWARFVIRPNVRYALGGEWSLAGGIGSLYTNNTEEGVADRWEIRPWQGIRLRWPNKKVSLDHFLRLEERFEWETVDWQLDASLRARYRLRAAYSWAAFLQQERYFQAFASAELFAKLLGGDEGQFQEQARLALGLERSFSRRARLRIEVVWQKVGSFFGGPTDDIYLRVRVFHGW